MHGYRFVSPSPPFPVPEIPLFLWKVLLFAQNLEHESTVFPHNEMGGKT